MGVISNSDFGDADDNWIYDKYPTTENATTNLNLYAKWTPLKTKIKLIAGEKESDGLYGSDGSMLIEYDNIKYTTFTGVQPAKTTDQVEGYFTEPEGHGGVMVFTSKGDFVTVAANLGEGKYFRSADSTYKWYKYNEFSDDVPLEITLYAHYQVTEMPVIKASTDVTVQFNHKGMFGSFTGTTLKNMSITYGTERIIVTRPVSDVGYYLLGYFADPSFTKQVAYADGRIFDTDNVDGFIEDGVWVCQEPEVTLYAKWSKIFEEPNVCNVIFMVNAGEESRAAGVSVQKMDNQLIEVGSVAALNPNLYTNGSRSFVGWNTKPDGTGLWYGDGYSSDKWEKGSIILYAQWTGTNDIGTTVSTDKFMAVNYVIKTANNSYVNSLYKANLKTRVRTTFMVDNYGTNSNSYPVLFGSRTSNHSANGFLFLLWRGKFPYVYIEEFGNNNKRLEGRNSDYFVVNCYSNVLHSVVESFNEVIVDGVKYGGAISLPTYTNTLDMYILGLNENGNWNGSWDASAFRGRMAYFEITEDGVAVMKLVPCVLKGSIDSAYSINGNTYGTGTVGFWDVANDKFYPNSGANALKTELD